jgi:8-oxo-dGTP pyrophosphatase MutT (NUDIX family)
VLAIIINDVNQILLVKRAEHMEWQPNKWSLIGGGVEDNEDPYDACIREIKEEVGILTSKIKQRFTIQQKPDNIEYVYIVKYDDDPLKVNLNKGENSAYGWYLPQEVKFLDAVPNLIDYINLAFKNYD